MNKKSDVKIIVIFDFKLQYSVIVINFFMVLVYKQIKRLKVYRV